MSIILTIIVFIVVFSLIILLHEFGHFIMAKRAGIKVEEFGVGLPPRIWGKKKGETIYSVNWIPFGGFVRMLGEDSTDESMMKKKRSFIAQSMRARVKVVIAGVVMNFFLAWLLLTIGFTAGMQPLLGPDDVLPAVDQGGIELVEGVRINELTEDGLASMVGMKVGDVLYSIDGEPVDSDLLASVSEDSVGSYEVIRDGKSLEYTVSDEVLKDYPKAEGLGVEFNDFGAFPRVKIFDVNPTSTVYKAGLRSGDVLLTVNGSQVFFVNQFEDLIREKNVLEYEIYRDGKRETFIVERTEGRRVIISRVLPNSPGAEAGLKAGDIVVSVNGVQVDDSEELIKYVGSLDQKGALAYLIERDGERIFYEIEPEDGKIGVLLSELVTYGGDQDMSLYNIDLLSSVEKIHDQQYPWYVSAYKSLGESVRMADLTAKMFVGVIVNLVSDGKVPEGVAGPVGIAQMTHVVVQEGFIPLLRFVAILSLSLAVINILPFPGLDGGRLFFIFIEFIIGRKVNQKWESFVHALGYVLILLILLAVTYSDILRAIGI